MIVLKNFRRINDWAHENDLDFHVTEIDYRIEDKNNSNEALEKQAQAYSNILAVLLSKKTKVLLLLTLGVW